VCSVPDKKSIKEMTLSVVSGVFLVNIWKSEKHGAQIFFLAEILKSHEILIFFGRTGEGLKSGRFSLPRGRITGMKL
jgi:hypothetical protein